MKRKRPIKPKLVTSDDEKQKPPSPIVKIKKGGDRPRWYNQSYLILMVLREAGTPLSRSELMKRTLLLDKKISKEKNLPKLFGGKTPENTVSGVLTTNVNGLFVNLGRLPGYNSMVFEAAFPPYSFEKALSDYDKWMKELIEVDWPIFFKKNIYKETVEETVLNEIDEFQLEKILLDHEKKKKLDLLDSPTRTTTSGRKINSPKKYDNPLIITPSILPTPKRNISFPRINECIRRYNSVLRRRQDLVKPNNLEINKRVLRSDVTTNEEANVIKTRSSCRVLPKKKIAPDDFYDGDLKDLGLIFEDEKKEVNKIDSSTIEIKKLIEENNPEEKVANDEFCFSKDDIDSEKEQNTAEEYIPKSIFELLEVKISTIPNAGKGCFALRYIPIHTIIGFYFGVPMTEDEFDQIKDNVGKASEYSIRWKYNVLDATNEEGLPYTFENTNNKLFCPIHFINESYTRSNVTFFDGSEVNQIWVVTTRDIKPGEELFVKYGNDVDRNKWESKSEVEKNSIINEEVINSSKENVVEENVKIGEKKNESHSNENEENFSIAEKTEKVIFVEKKFEDDLFDLDEIL
ncbi:hypothetical protein HK099_006167 [Clydaea vesicula]|uniref:SET domain-containing protein n=1 Tax=Clydaea vesicula TaxID=447962 RepID=A0AAD5XYE8_9FUNG|nr:hypothetical protein HK099_006167 [Clydaea vesicula]